MDRSLEVMLYPVKNHKACILYCTINTIRKRLQKELLKGGFKRLAAWMIKKKLNAYMF